MLFGVIGGTGFYRLAEEASERLHVDTRYGIVEACRVRVSGMEVAFVARHGTGHTVPPHRVNYRAIISALRELGVRNILASAAVGGISQTMPPGSLVVLTQFLDFTHGRESTFFDGEDGEVKHVDLTEPYCPRLREELREAADALGERAIVGGAYACMQGPRFETPAEIRMLRHLGADVVGMTNVPEVVLAREAGICYATVAAVTNWAAGVTQEPVKHEDVSEFMEQQAGRVRAVLEHVIVNHQDSDCLCRAWARE